MSLVEVWVSKRVSTSVIKTNPIRDVTKNHDSNLMRRMWRRNKSTKGMTKFKTLHFFSKAISDPTGEGTTCSRVSFFFLREGISSRGYSHSRSKVGILTEERPSLGGVS
jgi:hypothetical protein